MVLPFDFLAPNLFVSVAVACADLFLLDGTGASVIEQGPDRRWKKPQSAEAGAVALNQLVDVIQLRSRTLLSRKADDTRSVSGMHMSVDAALFRAGYDPGLEPGNETAGFAELVCK
jgi:hypothetical protein